MATLVDPASIAKAVQAEIERQQTKVVYDDMTIEELEAVIQHLEAKITLCKNALAKKGGSCCPPGGAMGSCCNACAPGGSSFVSSEPALRAAKSTGTWPDLPWTDRECHPALSLDTPAVPRPTIIPDAL